MIYTGQMKDNLQHGKGKVLFSDGSSYEGDWQYGKQHGYGVWKQAGKTFSGTWEHGLMHGEIEIDDGKGGLAKAIYKSGKQKPFSLRKIR